MLPMRKNTDKYLPKLSRSNKSINVFSPSKIAVHIYRHISMCIHVSMSVYIYIYIHIYKLTDKLSITSLWTPEIMYIEIKCW